MVVPLAQRPTRPIVGQQARRQRRIGEEVAKHAGREHEAVAEPAGVPRFQRRHRSVDLPEQSPGVGRPTVEVPQRVDEPAGVIVGFAVEDPALLGDHPVWCAARVERWERGPGPHAVAQRSEVPSRHRGAQLGPSGRVTPLITDDREGPAPVPVPRSDAVARSTAILASLAFEEHTDQLVRPVHRDHLARGGHPGQRRAHRAPADVEQLTRGDEGPTRQPGRMRAQQDRRQDRAGGERCGHARTPSRRSAAERDLRRSGGRRASSVARSSPSVIAVRLTGLGYMSALL